LKEQAKALKEKSKKVKEFIGGLKDKLAEGVSNKVEGAKELLGKIITLDDIRFCGTLIGLDLLSAGIAKGVVSLMPHDRFLYSTRPRIDNQLLIGAGLGAMVSKENENKKSIEGEVNKSPKANHEKSINARNDISKVKKEGFGKKLPEDVEFSIGGVIDTARTDGKKEVQRVEDMKRMSTNPLLDEIEEKNANSTGAERGSSKYVAEAPSKIESAAKSGISSIVSGVTSRASNLAKKVSPSAKTKSSKEPEKNKTEDSDLTM